MKTTAYLLLILAIGGTAARAGDGYAPSPYAPGCLTCQPPAAPQGPGCRHGPPPTWDGFGPGCCGNQGKRRYQHLWDDYCYHTSPCPCCGFDQGGFMCWAFCQKRCLTQPCGPRPLFGETRRCPSLPAEPYPAHSYPTHSYPTGLHEPTLADDERSLPGEVPDAGGYGTPTPVDEEPTLLQPLPAAPRLDIDVDDSPLDEVGRINKVKWGLHLPKF